MCTPYSKKEYFRSVTSLVQGRGLYKRETKPAVNSVLKRLLIPSITEEKANQIEWVGLLFELVIEGKRNKILDDVIVHGSYGDGTFTNFSDLDVTVVLSDGAIQKRKGKDINNWITKKINPLLLRVDPLQHHGVFFLWRDILENYNELILPISAYNQSWSVFGIDLQIRKSVDLDIEEQERAFISTIKMLMSPQKNFFRYGMNPYSIKRLISNFLLLPAFYYQSKNQIISKKEAIKKMLEAECMEIKCAIQAATYLRYEWPLSPEWLSGCRRLKTVKEIPNGRIDLLLSAFYRNLKLEKKFKNFFLPRLYSACHALLSKVKK